MSFLGPEKRYIGDAVYVEFDGYHVVLTTGDSQHQRICLEPVVFSEFERWAAELKKAIAEFSAEFNAEGK